MRPWPWLLLAPFLLTACPWISQENHDERLAGLVTDTGPSSIDADGDGHSADVDCDDDDPDVHPEADERCNGIDDDCDEEIDEDDALDATTWYADDDGDGYGDPEHPRVACEIGSAEADNGEDCDDHDPVSYPGADEICDGADNDCDDLIDDEDDVLDPVTWWPDGDGDGFGTDTEASVGCEQPSGYADASAGEDCDDSDPSVNPAADEYCNGVDDDCDLDEDESDALDALDWYADTDDDGYGDAAKALHACDAGEGWVLASTDCDDGDPAINPDADEICDLVDNDCDAAVDEDDAVDATTWWLDGDSDGFGSSSSALTQCSQPSGHVDASVGDDCDDSDATAHPGADEYCDGHDDDCDGSVDEDDAVDALEWWIDDDGDGYGVDSAVITACDQPSGHADPDLGEDCDDLDGTTHPGADEHCDGHDDDCDGSVDEDDAVDATTWYLDGDTDGFGDSATSLVQCAQPSGHVDLDGDCDDTDVAVHPSADEHCDGRDNDCDGTVDEGDAVDATTWWLDADADGFGSSSSPVDACSQPSGYADSAAGDDCDDAEASTHPGADEYCDGVDNDCDASVDEDESVDAALWWEDKDGDGYGSSSVSHSACVQPSGFADTSLGDDCDDSDAGTNPGADEHCDGHDDDCDGSVDEDDAVDAGAWYLDHDGDGYGDLSSATSACAQPSGYVADGTDCDDGEATVNPAADELCDGLDTDCDGAVDSPTPLDADTWWLDADGDGYGDSHSATVSCSQPSGYAAATPYDDCDDGDALINPGADDLGLNGVDEDCDGADETQLGLGDATTVIDGVSSDARVGWSVSGAGDLDADGYDDIMVGAPNDNGGAGTVAVFFGPTDPGSFDLDEADVIITGDSGSHLGSAIASLGDIDSDGYDDIILGASGQSSNAGMAYLIHGPITSDRAGDLKTMSVGGGTAHYLGDFVGGGDDVDGDGYGDLLIGAPLQDYGYTEGGRFYVVSSAYTTAVTASSAASITARTRNNGAHMGSSACTGDFDDDGVTDLVVAGNKAIVSGNFRGAAYLLSGPVAHAEYDLNNSDDYDGRVYGYASSTYFGASMANVGDVDGDGTDDLLVGSPRDYSSSSGAGAAFLFLSPWSSTIATGADAIFYGSSGEQAGQSVTALGDIDGSGKADWAVGVIYDNPIGLSSGAAYILLDTSSGTHYASGADGVLAGEGLDDLAGWSLSGAGDTDADGIPDLLVGAPEYDDDVGTSYGNGHAYLLTGLIF
jgi:hypothetical protein